MEGSKMINKENLKGPWRITFDTNPDDCNLLCIMCEEHSKYNIKKLKEYRIMNFELIEKVVEEIMPFGLKEIIPSTMGEPLLYSNFHELLELLNKHRNSVTLLKCES